MKPVMSKAEFLENAVMASLKRLSERGMSEEKVAEYFPELLDAYSALSNPNIPEAEGPYNSSNIGFLAAV